MNRNARSCRKQRSLTRVAGCLGCNLRIPILLLAIVLIFIPMLLSARYVKVGIAQNPPKTLINAAGKAEGIFVDILEAIAKEEGWELQYIPGTWEQNYLRLQKGELDLIPDMAYSEERSQIFSFHKIPVLSSWSQVYARKGLELRSLADIGNKRIAVLEKSIQQQTLQMMATGFGKQVKFISVASFDEAFQAVADNKADLVVTNYLFGGMNARKYGLVDTAIVMEPATLFYASLKGRNLDLLKAIDIQLDTMMHTPLSVYYQTIQKWTSQDIGYRLPQNLKLALILVGVILLFSIIAAFVLRHQVRVRTRELQESNIEMEHRIIRRTAELADAMQRAQEADTLKSAFLATMSHELRTPLNSIIGFTGLMLNELPGKINEEQRKQLRIVQASSRHLLDLINDVLDISKIEAGQLDLHRETFNLRESLDKLIKVVTPQATKKGLEINLVYAMQQQEIFSDKRRVEQIVLNLLSNAIKFTESGSVKLLVGRFGNEMKIQVIDTGIGIPETELLQLFKPFRQIDTGLTRKYDGSGLGLSICHQLSKLMGGSIAVESKEGEGSIFKVTLPLAQEEI